LQSPFGPWSVPGRRKFDPAATGPPETANYNVRLALLFDPCRVAGRIAGRSHGARDPETGRL
jgi:hypothetical protein